MDPLPVWSVGDLFFFTVFSLVGLSLVGFAVRVWFRAGRYLPQTSELQGYAVAYAGSPGNTPGEVEGRMLVGCLLSLRSRGLIAVRRNGVLRPTGNGRELTDPLDRAVFEAAVRRTRFRDLMEHDLLAEGFLALQRQYGDWINEARRAYLAWMRRARRVLLPLGLLLLAGAARLWAAVERDEVMAPLLLILLVSLGTAGAALAWWWVPRDLPWSLMNELRRRNHVAMAERLEELRERIRQGETDRRADEAVLSLVFFGTADLAAADPELDAMLRADERRRRYEAEMQRRREERELRHLRGRSGSHSDFRPSDVLYSCACSTDGGCGE